MTPNHANKPTADRKREQTPQAQPAGQQSLQSQPSQQPQMQQGQSQQSAQQIQQGQTPLQSTQHAQATPQTVQQSTPPSTQQGQATPQTMQQSTPLSTQQGQATPQTMQQGQGTQGVPPQQQPTQQSHPTHQSQQQPSQPAGQQQVPPIQHTQGGASGQGQYGQPAGIQSQPQAQARGPQQPLLKPRRVNEIITEDVVTAERDTPISTVVAMMAEKGVGSVIVVEDDRPVGIITDRKVALALEEIPDIAQRTAEELVHGDVFTADPSMSIFDAIQVMSDEGIRRLPIVDDNGALRGIVTLDDALVMLGGVVSDIADTVESQSPQL